MVAPIDFHITDGLLNVWSKHINGDLLVDAYGAIPGDLLNMDFNVRPFQLMLDKYVGFMENLDNPDLLRDFLRMEKWIFDSPSPAGATFRVY